MHDSWPVVTQHLDDRTQFLGEQHRQHAIAHAAIEHFGEALNAVDIVHQRIVAKRVKIQRNADMRSKSHFADRRKQATI